MPDRDLIRAAMAAVMNRSVGREEFRRLCREYGWGRHGGYWLGEYGSARSRMAASLSYCRYLRQKRTDNLRSFHSWSLSFCQRDRATLARLGDHHA